MDTKGLQHCKHPKKMKSSNDNGKHEVFVLPPDLLKKLGISIGNINETQVIPTNANIALSPEIINNEEITNIPTSDCSKNSSDTSILETASLMKKSVFLSPTFIPTIANVIPGEVEISRKNNTEGPIAVTDLVGAQSSVYIPVDSFENTNIYPETYETRKTCHKVDQVKPSCDCTVNGLFTSNSNNIEDYPHACLDGNEMQVADVNNITHKNLTKVENRVNDILYDSHSSKTANTLENTIKPMDSSSVTDENIGAVKPEQKLSSKINIISEETIPLPILKQLKSLQTSHVNALTPITVKTIISNKMKNKNGSSEAIGSSEQIPMRTLNNAELNVTVCNSEVDTDASNLNPKDNIQKNAAPRVISLQEVDNTCRNNSDIAMNIIENRKILENEIKPKHTRQFSLLDDSITVGEESIENGVSSNIEAIVIGQFNERHGTIEDTISGNIATVNGIDRNGIDADNVDKNKCIKRTNVYYNGQLDKTTKPEVSDINNHHSTENEYDPKDHDAEKPRTIEKDSFVDKYDVAGNSSNPEFNFDSYSKQINVSKTIVNDDCSMRTIDGKQTSNSITTLKNIKEKPFCNDELANILNATEELSSSNSNVKVDKVKEIAAYLKKFSHIYTDKKKIKKDLRNDKIKKDKLNSNTNMIKSKLSIQGVEKPGGKEVDRENPDECKVLKTYTRRNHAKKNNLSENILHKNEAYAADKASTNHTINVVNSSTSCKMQEFCLCYDFGRLAYYDYDSVYEHIHFWQQKAANCELNVIFSIYSDEAVVNNNESGLDREEKNEEKVETYNVCWNVFQNEFSENVDISDPEQKQYDYSIDGLNDACSGETPAVLKLNNVPQKENNTVKENSTPSKKFRQSHMMVNNNQNPDIILETVDHELDGVAESKNSDSVKKLQNIEKSLNINKHIGNASSTVFTTVETSFENKDTHFSITELNLPCTTSKSGIKSGIIEKVSMEASGAKEENAFDIKDKTYTNDQHTVSEINTLKEEPPRKEGKLHLSKPNENIALKRSLSVKTVSESSRNSNDEPSLKKTIKCGLCNNLFSEVDWDDHVTNRHHLIAWREGYSINLDSPDLLNKLKQRLESLGVLKCSICNTKWKKLKKFMKHVKNCIKHKDSNSNKSKEKPMRKSRAPVNEVVTCAVCQQTVQSSSWFEHIGRNHNYLAWIHGREALDVEDDAMVWEHLQNIIRLDGTLTCYKCGLNRRRVKLYLAHIKKCDGSGTCLDDSSMSVDLNSTSNLEDVEKSAGSNIVKCGVCEQDVTDSKWIEHIAKEHNYLAWQDGTTPLNLDEEEDVWNHLQQFIRQNGGLTCYKCGLNRRRVKLYLSHVETCDGTGVSMDPSMSIDLNSSSPVECVKRSRSSVADDKMVECGVCKQKVSNSNWILHIGKEHNYLAWQDGTTPLDLENKEAVWQHLQQIMKCSDGLTCYKCGLQRKRVKLYLSHVENCDGSECRGDCATNNISLDSTVKTDQWFEVPILSEEKKIVKCGVCSQEVPILEWVQHIGKEHNYLAWLDGSPPLNLEDELAVRGHLLNTSKQNGGLICGMCEKNMKYPKTYLQHVKECTGIMVSLDDSQLNDSDNKSNISLSGKVKTEAVICGVCGNKIESGEWIEHIQQVHQYMAWMDGQPPVDVNDAAMVHKHLTDISKMAGGLICLKCGVRRKYVKSYQQHVETCEGNMFGSELSIEMMSKDFLECGICAEKVTPKDWRDHAMKAHYNIAWVVGETPIDLNSPYAVESFLKEYMHRYNKLICKVCGISRASYVGFYAHIITCGKTEQETEMYKNVCDICHNKYLIIYRSQHMTMHREQEYALERKALAAKEKELKREEPVDVIQTGRRKAAEKAKTVIEKYKDSINEGAHHCSKCGFGTDIEKELSDHVCVEAKWGDASDSDESVNLEHCSDDDSDESDIDSNISDEEQEAREQDSHKKKRFSDNTSSSIPASKISRLPYQIKSINTYMKRSTDEFAEAYLTDEDIFTQWHSCEFEAVPDDEVFKYMPPIEESCKVRFDDNNDWLSYNRFESRREKDTIIMFVGASIQCMSWAPAHAHAGVARTQPQYVAALGGAGLIQIWDCGNLIETTPKFALGIAHDYGTIWAIDWCPSGARDVFDILPEPNKIHRLGLLAAACSNGSAYIFLVPYPSAITEKDKLFYKVKPVVELRLTMDIEKKCYENRKCYQATAIKWSVQKGHSHVVVGYADGTTAYYDLNGDSPLLRTTENGVTIFYPYHDERVQNSCIEDVDMYPCSSARAGGVVMVGSAGGAGAGALQSHVAAARIVFPPHWPAALLAGDDCLVNQSINELEWWGGGRRLGGMRCAAGCAWCGRLAAAALPLLRLMRLHPCFPEVHKQVIGTIQMTPLGSKRKRQTDELAMIVEPITYSEAVKKYGIEFKQITARDRSTQQKLSSMPREAFPERFPLSDVTAMQFCPTFRHHHKLALAMHAGLIVIINV